jgi:transcriptional regulator with XRE-family HTH domain
MTEEDAGRSPADLVAERLKMIRKDRGLSVAKLAARCAELGTPRLNRDVITNIEIRGRRQDVGITELFTLALALDVPPLALLLPLDGRDRLAITETVGMAPLDAVLWSLGELEPDNPDQRARWRTGAVPLQLSREAAHRIHWATKAQDRGDQEDLRQTLRALGADLDRMIEQQIVPPELPAAWVKQLRDGDKNGPWTKYPDDIREARP